jgi:hypothetical protein
MPRVTAGGPLDLPVRLFDKPIKEMDEAELALHIERLQGARSTKPRKAAGEGPSRGVGAAAKRLPPPLPDTDAF